MLNRMLFDVKTYQFIAALDVDNRNAEDNPFITTLELVPSSEALLEIRIKKETELLKTYHTTGELLYNTYAEADNHSNPNTFIGNCKNLKHIQITDIDNDEIIFENAKIVPECRNSTSSKISSETNCCNINKLQKSINKLLLEVEIDEASVLLEKISDSDYIQFKKISEACNNIETATDISHEESDWESNVPKLEYFHYEGDINRQEVWYEGTYRNLSVLPEEYDECATLIGNHLPREYYLKSENYNNMYTSKTNSCSESYLQHLLENSKADNNDKRKEKGKAEVKLLVKRTDDGREEIEIRSIHELLKSSAGKNANNLLGQQYDKNSVEKSNKSPQNHYMKETSNTERNEDKPVFTLQQLFVTTSVSEKNPFSGTKLSFAPCKDFSKSGTKIVALSSNEYPLQCESETNTLSSCKQLTHEFGEDGVEHVAPINNKDVSNDTINLYANIPFYPCYNLQWSSPQTSSSFTPNISSYDTSSLPKPYCKWLPPTKQIIGNSSCHSTFTCM